MDTNESMAIANQSVTYNTGTGDYGYYWHDHYYPLTHYYHHYSYPEVRYEKSKVDVAFSVLKVLMDKRVLKIERVKDFVDLVNKIANVL